jgi:putative effector of murein hydrolase LrgA (UPF0299 family)
MTWLLAGGMRSARLLLAVCLVVVPELQHTVAVGVPQEVLGALLLFLGMSLLLLGGLHMSCLEVPASALLLESPSILCWPAGLGAAHGTCQIAAGGSCL